MVQENELHPELLNVCSINPYHAYTSASRVVMMTGHLGQSIPIKGAEQRRTVSGREAEYAKYTFNAKLPVDATVLDIIKKYPSNFGHNSVKNNPETIVIYEIVDGSRTVEYDCIVLEQHCVNHQYFGFEMKPTEAMGMLRGNAFIPKDTTFLQPPSIDEDGGYKFGVNAKIAYLTHPSVAEDGLLIRRGFLDKLEYTTYESRTFGYGSKAFAVGSYTTQDAFKSIPVIGDKIRSDGVVVAMRDLIKTTAGIDQSLEGSGVVDTMFDNIIFSAPEGEVVNVTIISKDEIESDTKHLQAEREYNDYYMAYQRSIVDAYNKISRQCKERYGREPKLGNTLHRLVVSAKTIVESKRKEQRIRLSQRKETLDSVHVEVLIAYKHKPNIGSKATDLNGGKGVVCTIVDDEFMPYDAHGVVADLVMEPSISRMNLGRYYEPYINKASDKVHSSICAMLGVKPYKSPYLEYNEQSIKAFDFLNYYLTTINPDSSLSEVTDKQDVIATLEHIALHGITVWIPTNNKIRLRDVVSSFMKDPTLRPDIGSIYMKRPSGKVITIKDKVLIADVYILLLQQTGSDWSATSSGKTQIHGLLASTSRATKYTTPYKDQGTRTLGESEMRIISAYCGGQVAAHLHNINNNPSLHRVICDNILSAKNSTHIQNVCEGANEQVCGNAPVNLSRHLLECYGVELYYKPYDAALASTAKVSKDIEADELKEL